MSAALARLEARIGHTFKDRSHLVLALTHPSWGQDAPGEKQNNQRLEFLGDVVIRLVLSEALFRQFPRDREGTLTSRCALLVNGPFLARLARETGVDAALRLGSSEEATGGRKRDGALGDAFEALMGAVFLDAGIEVARRVLLGIYGDLPTRLAGVEAASNPKGRLQELVQPLHGNTALRYEVVKTAGLDHAKEFEVVAYLHDRALGSGRGSTKKIAEEAAAVEALAKIAVR
jgi:ribonuclease-3